MNDTQKALLVRAPLFPLYSHVKHFIDGIRSFRLTP